MLSPLGGASRSQALPSIQQPHDAMLLMLMLMHALLGLLKQFILPMLPSV